MVQLQHGEELHHEEQCQGGEGHPEGELQGHSEGELQGVEGLEDICELGGEERGQQGVGEGEQEGGAPAAKSWSQQVQLEYGGLQGERGVE